MKTFEQWWEKDSPFKGVVDKGMAGCIWNAATDAALQDRERLTKVIRRFMEYGNVYLCRAWESNPYEEAEALLKEAPPCP